MTPNQNIALLKIGHPKHKEAAATALINDKSKEGWLGREAVAQYGNDSHRDKLIKDKNSWVRAYVAKYGNDSHRDKLVNDEHPAVRNCVARYGNDSHRDILKFDRDPFVRENVARFGNYHHADFLSDDPFSHVAEAAISRKAKIWNQNK